MLRYRLYIDESGDHSYGNKELKNLQIKIGNRIINITSSHYPILKEPSKRYLGLTGCIIEEEYYRTLFQPELEQLKQKHFPHNPDDPVILHRKDIVNKRGPFWRLKDPKCREAFDEDLLFFLNKMKYTIITVVIDKKTHIERYDKVAYHPYHYCLVAILERYCGFLHYFNAKGDVMAESRGGREDHHLKIAYKEVYNHGTLFRRSNFFKSVLTSKEIKIKPKRANIAGLQVSDILAYPSKQEILVENGRLTASSRSSFRKKICDILGKKYNRRYPDGKVSGYGKIFLK